MSVSRFKQPRWQLTGLAMALAAVGMFQSPQVLACPSGTVDGKEALDSDCSIVQGNTVGVATTGTLELNDFIWSIKNSSDLPFGKIENEGTIEATGSTGRSYILIDNINNEDSSFWYIVLDNESGASITKPSTTASPSDRALLQIKDSSGISVTNAGSIRSSVSGDGVVKVLDSTNTAISNSGIIAARLTDDVAYADDSAGVVIDSLDGFGDGTIATITNQTGGLIGGDFGLFIGTNKSAASIQSNITNSGVIEGSSGAILVGGEGLVFSLSNNENARIGRSVPADTFQYGVALAGGQINTLTNEGTIEGGQFGAIFNQGAIGTLTNETTGTLDGAIYVRPSATLGSFTNVGTVQGTLLGPGQFVDVEGEYAIYNAGTITALTNEASGRLEGDVVVGTVTDGFMTNKGVIDGKVTLGSVGLKIEGTSAQIKGAVTGTGEVTIDGTFTTENTFDVGIINIASNGSLTVNHAVTSPVKMSEASSANLIVNNDGESLLGSIRSAESSTTVVWSDRSGGSVITNAGTIEARLAEGEDYASGSVGVLFRQQDGTTENSSTLTNQAGGVIGAQTGVVVGFEGKNNDQAVVSISNAGTIDGSDYGLDLRNGSTITLLDNMEGGTISGGDAGLRVGGDITTVTNKGTIVGALDLASSATIGTFTNEGTIEGSSLSELGVYAIYSPGTITTLTNQKGARIEGDIGFTASTSSLGTFTNNGDVEGQVEFRFVESSPSLVNNAGASIRSAATYASVVEVTDSPFAVVSNAGIIAARLSDEDEYAEGSVGVTFVGEDLTLNNREGGQIGAGSAALEIGNGDGKPTTAKVTNAGTINGGRAVVVYEGATVSSLDNKSTGEITAIGSTGLNVSGTIESLTNAGLVQSVIQITNSGTIDDITNDGVIRAKDVRSTSGNNGRSVRSFSGGTIKSLTNNKTIEGRIFSQGSLASLTNNKGATIRAAAVADEEDGNSVIDIIGNTTVTNAGVIAARLDDEDPYVVNSYGVTLKDGTATFSNLEGGTVGGAIAGLQIETPSTDESTQANITNAGTIEGSLFGVAVRSDAFVDEFTNSEGGIIRGEQVGVFNEGTITTLANDGTIEGAVYQTPDRTITSLTNKGTIKAATGGELAGYAIYNAGTIGTLTNDATGTLEGKVLVGNVGTFTNKGLIDGEVDLGGVALDLVGNSGRITGKVTGTGSINVNGTFTTENTLDAGVINIGADGSLTVNDAVTSPVKMPEAPSAELQVNKGGSIRMAESDGTVVWSDRSGGSVITNAGTIESRLAEGEDYATGSVGVLFRQQDGTTKNSSTLTNQAGGVIGAQTGVVVGFEGKNNDQAVVSVSNAGTIDGADYGLDLRRDSTITLLDNMDGGTITGGDASLRVRGEITTLNNKGTIDGVVDLASSGTIGTFTNEGTIEGSSLSELGVYAIYNAGTMTSLINEATGKIEGDLFAGSVGTVTNKGLIDGEVTLGSGSTLNIEGASARMTGAVTGSASTVNVKGTFATENTFDVEVFNIATGGTLTLAHKITTGPNSFHNDGTMIVATGTQNIVGNFTTTGTFSPSIVDRDNYAKLVVDGDVELSGTLKANNGQFVASLSEGDVPAVVSLDDIITYTGSREGKFDEVIGANSLFNWAAEYDDAQKRVNLLLTASSGPLPFVVAAGYVPAYPAAQALETISDTDRTNPVVLSFMGVPDEQVADAVVQTLPLLTGNSQLAAMNALNDIDDAVKARLDFNRGELTDGAMFTDRKVWIRPFGSWVDQKNRGDYYGYSGSTGGLVVGADANVATGLQMGLAFGYAQASIKGNTPIQSNNYDLDTYQVLGYGRYELGQDTELEFQAGVGMNKNKGTRQLSLQATTAKSSYDSTTASAGLGLRHQLKINSSTTFTPEVRADYGWISDDGYTESGAQSLNLIVKGRDHDQLMLSAGGHVSYEVQKGLALRAGLAVGYDALNSQAQITSAYSGAPQTTFVTDGIDPSPWQLMGNLALVGELANGMQVSATYGASYRQDFLNQNVSLNLRIGF